MPCLRVKQKYFEIILKLFQRFISHVTTVGGYNLKLLITHVTTAETEIKIISAAKGVPNLFENYFSDNEHVGKYS